MGEKCLKGGAGSVGCKIEIFPTLGDAESGKRSGWCSVEGVTKSWARHRPASKGCWGPAPLSGYPTKENLKESVKEEGRGS